jgi:hypothetical protein
MELVIDRCLLLALPFGFALLDGLCAPRIAAGAGYRTVRRRLAAGRYTSGEITIDRQRRARGSAEQTNDEKGGDGRQEKTGHETPPI